MAQFKVEYSVYVYICQLENKLIMLDAELPHPEIRLKEINNENA